MNWIIRTALATLLCFASNTQVMAYGSMEIQANILGWVNASITPSQDYCDAQLTNPDDLANTRFWDNNVPVVIVNFMWQDALGCQNTSVYAMDSNASYTLSCRGTTVASGTISPNMAWQRFGSVASGLYRLELRFDPGTQWRTDIYLGFSVCPQEYQFKQGWNNIAFSDANLFTKGSFLDRLVADGVAVRTLAEHTSSGWKVTVVNEPFNRQDQMDSKKGYFLYVDTPVNWTYWRR